MSSIMTKRGNQDNIVTYEFVCDTTADLQAIESEYVTMGSIATVIQGETGFEVYMANSQKEWVNIGGGSNNSGPSEPVWVNQDIFTSVPETVSQEYNGETKYFATNMSLNNHVIQGNIVPLDGGPNSLGGYFTANINPSLTTSFDDFFSTRPESNQEYYVACVSMPASTYDITDDTINTVIVPIEASVISAIEGLAGDVIFGVFNTSDTLYIYKIPGYIYSTLYSSRDTLLIHYLFSSLQPEATYDISQLTYETPQAGE